MIASWRRGCGGAVLGLILACGVGGHKAAAAEGAGAACVMAEVGEFNVRFIGRRPLVDVEINGRPTSLMIDTGADSTMLFRDHADALGLALRPVPNLTFYGVGGGVDAFTARIAKLKIGALTAQNMDVFVTGQSKGVVGSSELEGPAGLLGEAFLGQADVEFDFAAHKVRFFKPKNCSGDQVVYWGKAYSVAPILPVNHGDKIDVEITLNGQKVRAEMDTGASRSIVTTGAAEAAGARSTDETPAGKATGLGKTAVTAYAAIFPSFGFGDEVIRNARLRVANLFAADTVTHVGSRLATRAIDPPQMLLGADFFSAHRVYVARSQGKVYISYQGGPVFDITAPRKSPAEADAPGAAPKPQDQVPPTPAAPAPGAAP